MNRRRRKSEQETNSETQNKLGADDFPVVLDDVRSSLAELAEVLDREDDLRTLLSYVARQVIRVLPGVDHATITLLSDHHADTVATTSDDITELDDVQYQARRGPCLAAAETGQVMRVAIDEAAQRWPEFTATARAAGVHGFVSAPLRVDDEHGGAINCYSWHRHDFDEIDGHLLELYMSAVETALRVYRRYERARELATQLATALESRGVIDQAKGVLMAIHAISADEAFTLLVEQSQRDQVKVRDLAQQIVERVAAAPPA